MLQLWPVQGPGSASSSVYPSWARNTSNSKLQMSLFLVASLIYRSSRRVSMWLCNCCGHTANAPAFNRLAWLTKQCGKVAPVMWAVWSPSSVMVFPYLPLCWCVRPGHFREILYFSNKSQSLLWNKSGNEISPSQPVVLLYKSLTVLSEATSRFFLIFRKHTHKKKQAAKLRNFQQHNECMAEL